MSQRSVPPAGQSVPRTVSLAPVLLFVAGLLGCAPSGGRNVVIVGDSALADTLKTLIARAYDFSRPGAAERMMALYPDTGRVVSASGGQVFDSPDSVKAGIAEFWQSAGRNMRDAKWEWGKVLVDRLSADAAVLTATWSIPHIAPTGRPHVIQGAWTAVFRRFGPDWKIVVEHLSIPPT